MTTWTPAPWVVREPHETNCPIIDAPSVGRGYFSSIATATQRDPHPIHGGGISADSAKANARLIAASPDLLAALENALNVLAALATGDLKTIDRDSNAIQLARAAIARATS